MFFILPHTHAFRCRRPGPAPVYLASQPTVTGTVNTDHISYLDCVLRTARLNDDCGSDPITVSSSPHYPHTRPQDVPARLVYRKEVQEGLPVPEDQYQERFWRRRLDGIGLDTVNKEFLAIEFKRTQDMRSNYVEKATAVAQA
jgi:hypothetical protein